MSTGWIKLHREIRDMEEWYSEPLTRAQAWVDLLLRANTKPAVIYIRGHRIEVGIGELAYAEKTLAEDWRWSRGKVSRFLDDLQKRGRIGHQKNNVTTCISITNWEAYQQNGHQTDTRRTPDGHQTDTNKNRKNRKKGESVGLADEQQPAAHAQPELALEVDRQPQPQPKATRFAPPTRHEWLDFAEAKLPGWQPHQALNAWDYYQANGWRVGKAPMKDWQAAARRWWRADMERKGQVKPQPQQDTIWS